jgi:hypothetical protein
MIAFETTSAKNQTEWNSWNPTGLAPLTTRFEPPPACSTQWIQNPYNATNIRSGDGSFASWPADGGPAIRYDYSDYFASNYYARCRPYNQPQTQAYSPGICTKGQTVAAIRELLYDSTRRWIGWCCGRCPLPPTTQASCRLRFHQGQDHDDAWRRLSRQSVGSKYRADQLYEHDCGSMGPDGDNHGHRCHYLVLYSVVGIEPVRWYCRDSAAH